MSATLVRLFLVQESYEVFARMVVYYLGLQAMREQYLPRYVHNVQDYCGSVSSVIVSLKLISPLFSDSCWSGLYTSLLQFFSAWLPDHIGKVSLLNLMRSFLI